MTENKWNSFEIDPLNPFVQIVGIVIGGWLIGVFVNSILRWIIWGVGITAWIYFTFWGKAEEGVKFWSEAPKQIKENKRWTFRR